MNRHILTIMAAAIIIAGSMTSCSKDGDEITVDRIHTTATADKIIIENEIIKETIAVIPEEVTALVGCPEIDCGVKVYGEQAVSYTSANEKIATVSQDGKVKATAKGETSISININGKEMGKTKVVSTDEGFYLNGLSFTPTNAIYYWDDLFVFEDNKRNELVVGIKNGKISDFSFNELHLTSEKLAKCTANIDEVNNTISVTLDIENEGAIYKGSYTTKYEEW